MKRKLRKPLSWLLTVAMIFSLFCGMIPTASAASTSNQYVSIDYDEDSSTDTKTTLTVNVVGTDGKTVATTKIDSLQATANTITISLNGDIQDTYDIESVSCSGGSVTSEDLNSDTYKCLFTGYNRIFTVKLADEFVPPEIKNPIDATGTIVYHISEPQMLKILHEADVDLANVDLESIDAQVRYVEQYGLNWTNSFSDINRADNTIPYYNMDLETSGLSDKSHPNNIRQLEITYEDLGGNEHEVIVSSGDLRYVGDGNRTYNIEARDDSEYIVAFYYEVGSEWDRWTLHDFVFVPAGTSVGVDQMPNDPDYTVGGVEINDYQFVSWDYGVRGGYPFRYTDTIQDDTVVYAQKVSSEDVAGSEFHVMNQTAVVDRVVEIYNAKHPENPISGNINITNIQINGDNGTATNNSSVTWDNRGYYNIKNYTVNSGHVPFNAVESMTVFFTLPGGDQVNVGIQAGVNAGEFSVSRVQDHILEIHINKPPTAPTDPDLMDDPEDDNDPAILGKNAVEVICTNTDRAHNSEILSPFCDLCILCN